MLAGARSTETSFFSVVDLGRVVGVRNVRYVGEGAGVVDALVLEGEGTNWIEVGKEDEGPGTRAMSLIVNEAIGMFK